MRCDHSRKRDILTTWGLLALAYGMAPTDVRAAMRQQSRRTIAEIQEWVKASPAALAKAEGRQP